MRTALVCGAGGFIGGHLVKRLKREGFWVRGVDLKFHEYSETEADDFVVGDLREQYFVRNVIDRKFDEVYQLAADMGSGKGVRDYGQMLVTDHGAHKVQAGQIATALGVAIPDDATPEANLEYEKLMAMKGADFDKEFVSYMVDDHKKDIDKYKQEAASTDPAQVKDLVNQTLPTLQKHLETAQSLQKG